MEPLSAGIAPAVGDAPRRPWGEPARSTLPALDGLRALAVLAVLLTHVGFQTGRTSTGQVGAVLARLDIGVTLFFLLSGFLLYRPYAAAHFAAVRGPRLAVYLRNRALRILPAYWLLVLVVVPVMSPGKVGTGELVRQALLLQTATGNHLLAGLTQTWSLVVEVGFYLTLPLLAAAVQPRRGRTPHQQLRAEGLLLTGMVVVAVAWTVAVHGYALGDERVTGLWLPGYLDWFALGMGLAVLRSWREAGGRSQALDELATATGSWLVLAGLLFWLATGPIAGPRGLAIATGWEALTKHLLYGLIATCLLLPLVLHHGSSRWERLLASPVARHVGRVSYGVFLWQLLALDLVFRLPGFHLFSGRTAEVAVLTVAVSLVLAELSLRLVEEPALRRKLPAVR